MNFSKHRVGVGLRPTHYPYLETRPRIQASWFEAITENYMDSMGRPREMLRKIRQDYPLALHGVSLNIGAAEGVRLDYLKRLQSLIDDIDPFIVSDHLCWTGVQQQNLHDLLPLPFHCSQFSILVQNISIVQETLKRPIVLENISSYFRFVADEMSEWDFINEVCAQTGCQVLLDINNVLVNAFNHHFAPADFINGLRLDHVAQIHLGGHTDCGRFLFDTHTEITDPVWRFLEKTATKIGHLPLLIERDEDIPPFQVLEQDVVKALNILQRCSHDSVATTTC